MILRSFFIEFFNDFNDIDGHDYAKESGNRNTYGAEKRLCVVQKVVKKIDT